MILSSICPPALIYIGFSLIQIFIDIYNNSINAAFLKFIFMLVFTLIINILCDLGFVVIAWIIVFIPIIMMTLISTLLLQVFGLDPKSNNLRSQTRNAKDISDNDVELNGSELLNQQKYAYYYEHDQYENANRVDRDELRRKLYDNIDEVYKLPINVDSVYDLSNNPKKYFIADKIFYIVFAFFGIFARFQCKNTNDISIFFIIC
jgi:ABC-type multidrug transport system fused ATPase/permease subunit